MIIYVPNCRAIINQSRQSGYSSQVHPFCSRVGMKRDIRDFNGVKRQIYPLTPATWLRFSIRNAWTMKLCWSSCRCRQSSCNYAMLVILSWYLRVAWYLLKIVERNCGVVIRYLRVLKRRHLWTECRILCPALGWSIRIRNQKTLRTSDMKTITYILS